MMKKVLIVLCAALALIFIVCICLNFAVVFFVTKKHYGRRKRKSRRYNRARVRRKARWVAE